MSCAHVRTQQFEDIMEPPSYQALYGFMDGAQTDLYDGVGKTQPTGSGSPASTTQAGAKRS